MAGRDLESAEERRRLETWLCDARERTRALVLDLDTSMWDVPRLAILTPFQWEFAHVTWFHERFTLREGLGDAPLHADIDALYDSSVVPHADRWDLEAFDLDTILDWDNRVRARQLEAIQSGDRRFLDLVRLAVFHEDMHAEAFAMMRQALAYPAPSLPFPLDGPGEKISAADGPALDGDVDFESARMLVGSERGGSFDNERGGVQIMIPAYSIARRCVSELEFLAFVEDDGYGRREFWSDQGWTWLKAERVVAPATWSREAGAWFVREFQQKRALEPELPVMHVSRHECEAWCRWAGRRLPSEFEWEHLARARDHDARFPWGETPSTARASSDMQIEGGRPLVAAQDAHSAGRCGNGAAHLIGNVWEWTASSFQPYPGFRPGAYANYSVPFWRRCKVLRGGSWATTQRMLSSTMRNFYEPDRRDIFAGFRSCALEP